MKKIDNSIRNITRKMVSKVPISGVSTSGSGGVFLEEVPIEQAPISMMEGVEAHNVRVSGNAVWKSWTYLFEYQKKKFMKKKQFDQMFCKVTKNYEMLFFEDDHPKSKPVKKFKIQDCTYKKKNYENFIIEVHTNDYNNLNIKRRILVKLMNNVDWGDLIRTFKTLDVEDISKQKKKKVQKGRKNYSKLSDEEKSFSKPVRIWDNNDVLNWAKKILVGKFFDVTLFELAEDYLRSQKITGKYLLSLTRNNVSKFASRAGVTEFKSKTLLKKEIMYLKNNTYFDPVRFVVIQKIIEMLNKRGQKSSLLITKFFTAFGDGNFIKENMINIMYGEDESKVKKTMVFRVKLIIVENMQDDRMMRVRKVLGRFLQIKEALNIQNNNTKYGLFHAALSIGPLQLEWVDTSLTIVRKVSSEKVLLCVDVANIEIEDGDAFCKRLTKEILRWNRDIQYEAFKIRKNQKYANCQEFVVSMMKFLGIQYKFTKHIDFYIENRLKKKGCNEMVFDFSKDFAKKFQLQRMKKRRFKPKKHKYLDDFVNHLFRICPDFKSKYNSEYSLLKGFDRAFWMKKMKFGNSKPEFLPAERIEGSEWSGCPFCVKTVKKLVRREETVNESDVHPQFENDDDDMEKLVVKKEEGKKDDDDDDDNKKDEELDDDSYHDEDVINTLEEEFTDEQLNLTGM